LREKVPKDLAEAAVLLLLSVPLFWAVMATAGLAAAAFKMVKEVRGGKVVSSTITGNDSLLTE